MQNKVLKEELSNMSRIYSDHFNLRDFSKLIINKYGIEKVKTVIKNINK